MKNLLTAAAFLLLAPSLLLAQELKPLKLPAPDTSGGKPIMQVLRERKSSREFSTKQLPLAELSSLLWAAFGINRPDTGDRTAPSARGWQETDVYVATAEGLYLYDAKAQALQPILKDDIRALAGKQSFVASVPVNLIYVADYSRMDKASAADKDFYSATGTGFIAENVYLYCASRGLAVVVRGSIDREALAKAMKLRPDQKITLAQSVGYPST